MVGQGDVGFITGMVENNLAGMGGVVGDVVRCAHCIGQMEEDLDYMISIYDVQRVSSKVIGNKSWSES